MSSLADFRTKYQLIALDDRADYLKSLSSKEQLLLFTHPRVFLFDKQIPPEGNWRYHWYRGGRGTGKTFASTSWLYEKIINGAREVAIVCPDYSSFVKEVKPVFESHFPPDKKPKFNGKDNMYTCYNGCVVKVYSSDTEIRGLNAEYAIADEICKWCDGIPDKIEECFNVFNMGVRSRRAKPNPQIFIASTPKPFPFFINFENKVLIDKNPLYSMVIAVTDENEHLSPAAKQAYHDMYDGTRLGRQELHADLLTDNPNALWTQPMMEKCHLSVPHFNQLIQSQLVRLVRTVVAVDPAVSTNKNSDETGIIVAGLGSDNKVYIIQDLSGKLTPDEWQQKAVQVYTETQAQLIIMESNQGGNLLEQAVKAKDRYVRTKLIHASVGKTTRFEPVVAAYERGEVYHVGNMPELERQMMMFNPLLAHQDSPDRADAVAYAVYELLINQQLTVPRSIRNLGNW